jgi:phosphoribosyl-ATP pyrophosphohydrolase
MAAATTESIDMTDPAPKAITDDDGISGGNDDGGSDNGQRKEKCMSDVMQELYEVILSRREDADENSYTAYLFREGLDKILKKVGEESAETIIAAKSHEAALSISFADGSVSEATAPSSGDVPETRPPADGYAENARSDLTNEVADLVYHLLVMLVERGVTWDEIVDILAARAAKTGNLKPPRDPQ